MRHKYLVFLLLFGWALSGCQSGPQQASARGGQTSIDEPKDGATLPLGPVRISVHSEDPQGLATIEIRINGKALQTSTVKADITRSSAYMSTVWTPTEDGKYLIEAMATDINGEKGPVAQVNVTITGTATTSSAQAATPDRPDFVSTVPAAAPTASGSSSSQAPFATSTPGRIAGASTPAGRVAPLLVAPIKTGLVPCASLTLAWQAPSDAKAAKYDVELLKISGKDPVPVKTWNDVAETTVAFAPECNILYRWRVRGKSDTGNSMDWSDYEDFRTGPPSGK